MRINWKLLKDIGLGWLWVVLLLALSYGVYNLWVLLEK